VPTPLPFLPLAVFLPLLLTFCPIEVLAHEKAFKSEKVRNWVIEVMSRYLLFHLQASHK
jgi:hypothetical protein